MKIFILLLSLLMLPPESFKQSQSKFRRVKDAYSEKENTVKNYFLHKNLNYQGFHLFVRAFKQERTLEVWVSENGASGYQLLVQYDFCSISGTLGPKRKEGDRQIPEGVYHINHFNPNSNFHLSLGLNYPNQSDLLLGDKQTPGSAIYIHGNCVTIGCIPISDDKIKELYILCVEAVNNGQRKIPVHIFPARLTNENIAGLRRANAANSLLTKFWENLQPIYNDFEINKSLRDVNVDADGKYYF